MLTLLNRPCFSTEEESQAGSARQNRSDVLRRKRWRKRLQPGASLAQAPSSIRSCFSLEDFVRRRSASRTCSSPATDYSVNPLLLRSLKFQANLSRSERVVYGHFGSRTLLSTANTLSSKCSEWMIVQQGHRLYQAQTFERSAHSVWSQTLQASFFFRHGHGSVNT